MYTINIVLFIVILVMIAILLTSITMYYHSFIRNRDLYLSKQAYLANGLLTGAAIMFPWDNQGAQQYYWEAMIDSDIYCLTNCPAIRAFRDNIAYESEMYDH